MFAYTFRIWLMLVNMQAIYEAFCRLCEILTCEKNNLSISLYFLVSFIFAVIQLLTMHSCTHALLYATYSGPAAAYEVQ